MEYQLTIYTMLLLFFAKTGGAQDDFTNLTTTMQEQIYNISKNLPLIGCTVTCSVNPSDVKFYLYSNSIQNETLVDVSNPSLSTSKTTAIIMFGWLGRKDLTWVQNMTTIFITKYNYDVVVVDWSKWSRTDYISAASAVKCVGFIIGEFLANSHQKGGVPVEYFKLVGFSLGAHTAGFSGKKFQELTGQKLPDLFGLDPAGPCFKQNSEKDRLCPTDAQAVHAIHCNAYKFGITIACGTADTWANGGCFQPGCIETFFTNPLDVNKNIACSHYRCYEVFIQALLNPGKLLAQECGPWIGCNTAKATGEEKMDIGELQNFQTGEFCINTTDTEPYFN